MDTRLFLIILPIAANKLMSMVQEIESLQNDGITGQADVFMKINVLSIGGYIEIIYKDMTIIIVRIR